MKTPVIRILSPQLDLLGEIDLYTSLMFPRSWQGVGEWEFHTAGPVPGAALTEGNFIMLDSDGRRAGIIRSVEQKDGANGVEVTVKGQTLNGLACQRYTIPLEGAANGGYDTVPALSSPTDTPAPVSAETILKTYAQRHLSNPLDPKRKIPLLTVAQDLGRGMKSTWISRYEQLDGVLQLAAEYLDTGWEISIDLDGKRLVFDVVPGVDRTDQQSENSRVLFSLDYESAQELVYSHSISNYKNVAYAGGAGEGPDRLVLKVTNEAQESEGLERHEVFIDCGALELTETDSALSLGEEGKHKLQDYPRTESLTAAIAPGGSFEYRKHWDLGDLVTVIDRSFGVAHQVRVSGVSERYEAGQLGLDVTFGEAPKHLNRVIRSLKNTVK